MFCIEKHSGVRFIFTCVETIRNSNLFASYFGALKMSCNTQLGIIWLAELCGRFLFIGKVLFYLQKNQVVFPVHEFGKREVFTQYIRGWSSQHSWRTYHQMNRIPCLVCWKYAFLVPRKSFSPFILWTRHSIFSFFSKLDLFVVLMLSSRLAKAHAGVPAPVPCSGFCFYHGHIVCCQLSKMQKVCKSFEKQVYTKHFMEIY